MTVTSRSAAGRDRPTEDELVERVLAMHGAGGWPVRPSAGVAVPEVCPYMGPAPFGVGDAAYFFGRERLVAELAARLDAVGFAAIVGACSSGKSSLLQAGLLSALAGGVLAGSAGWRQVLIRPGPRPLARLRGALGLAADLPIPDVLDRLGDGERLLVAVDQLEEVFSVCDSQPERVGFLAALADLATDGSGRAAVVVAVRADSFERFADQAPLAALMAANRVPVGPMSASELRRAVELPAARAGLLIEPDLVDAVIDDVAGEPGALPVLSAALAQLWRRRSGSTITLAAYRACGGAAGAAAGLAETTYLGIPEGLRALARATLLRLVAQGPGGSAVPGRAPLAEFDQHDPEAASVLEALAEGRVVTLSEEHVELAHRGLLRRWPRLRDWIGADEQARRRRSAITDAAAQWDAGGRDPADLDRGARLAAALEYGADHELGPLEHDFVAASSAAAETRNRQVHMSRRTLGGLLAGTVVILVAALMAGMLALQQRERAEQAETERLAHSLGAQALVEQRLDLSLLLARQAVALHDTPQLRGYLLEVLLRHPAAIGTMRTSSGQGAQQALAVSPDGATLAVADPEAGLFFFDAHTFDPIGEPARIPYIRTLAFSPDGRTLAYAARAGVDQIGLVDTGSHKRLASANSGEPSRIAYTPDGSHLVVIDTEAVGEPRVRRWLSIWDAGTLTRVYRPTPGLGFVPDEAGDGERGPALSDDGSSLLTSTDGRLTLWDVESQQVVWTQQTDQAQFEALAVSPDRASVAVAIVGGIRLIDVATSQARALAMAPGASPSRLVFSHDGSALSATSSDGTSVWDTRSLRQTASLDARWPSVGPTAIAPDGRSAFSPDGRTLFTPGSDGMAVAWDVAGSEGVRARVVFSAGAEGDRLPARFSPDGRIIAVALAGEGIGLWDAVGLAPSGPALLPTLGQVHDLAFSADGRRVAAVGSEGLTIWNLESGSLLASRAITDWADGLSAVAFGPGGEEVAVASGRGVRLFDVATGAEKGNLLGAQQTSSGLAFSPTRPIVAFTAFTVWPGDTGRVQVMDFDQGSPIVELELSARAVSDVEFSPDGRWLAASYADPLVQIWDADTWEPVSRIRPATESIAALDFSPDGSVLAVADQQGHAALWDVGSGSQLGVPLEFDAGRPTIDFSPDGRRLLAATGSGSAVVWDVDPRSWARRACAVANRTLTQQEWEQYVTDRPYDPACAG